MKARLNKVVARLKQQAAKARPKVDLGGRKASALIKRVVGSSQGVISDESASYKRVTYPAGGNFYRRGRKAVEDIEEGLRLAGYGSYSGGIFSILNDASGEKTVVLQIEQFGYRLTDTSGFRYGFIVQSSQKVAHLIRGKDVWAE